MFTCVKTSGGQTKDGFDCTIKTAKLFGNNSYNKLHYLQMSNDPVTVIDESTGMVIRQLTEEKINYILSERIDYNLIKS